MSKKIKIILSNSNRPNLSLLFHSYLLRKHNERMKYADEYGDGYDYASLAEYWDEVFPGWDSDDGNDFDIMYPLKGKSKSSRNSSRVKHKHGKRKGSRKCIDIDVPYSGYEDGFWGDDDYDDDYDDLSTGKIIWFYPDYHDKEYKLEFNSLKSFDKYCKKMGYSVPSYVATDIIYRTESHCCLNPLSEKDGILEVLSEHSYGEMFYEACDVSELSQ